MANNQTQSEERVRDGERKETKMATAISTISSPFLSSAQSLCKNLTKTSNSSFPLIGSTNTTRPNVFRVRAAKLPAGVVMPKMEPKLTEPFLGFTKTAEIWNSRACMIGLIGTFIVELIFHRGILQMIGVDVGKGLDIPL